MFYIFRNGRVWKVNLHQTDANHPRERVLGRGQEVSHQAGLPEHLHGHAVHDQGHGSPKNTVRRRKLPCKDFSYKQRNLLKAVEKRGRGGVKYGCYLLKKSLESGGKKTF